jgi:hypothetical protein
VLAEQHFQLRGNGPDSHSRARRARRSARHPPTRAPGRGTD